MKKTQQPKLKTVALNQSEQDRNCFTVFNTVFPFRTADRK